MFCPSHACITQNVLPCRVKPSKSTRIQSYKSLKLVLIIASLYCVWCGSQIYMVNPRRPAVGEEADLGVLVFLATYFFLPHWFCICPWTQKTMTRISFQFDRITTTEMVENPVHILMFSCNDRCWAWRILV